MQRKKEINDAAKEPTQLNKHRGRVVGTLVSTSDGWSVKFFLEGDVKSPVQTDHKLPKNPTNLVTTLAVVTKKSSSIPQHTKGSIPVVDRVWIREDVKSRYQRTKQSMKDGNKIIFEKLNEYPVPRWILLNIENY